MRRFTFGGGKATLVLMLASGHSSAAFTMKR
jgi:hypothetical protein